VDTGCPLTLLDQSLEPKLGARLGQGNIEDIGLTLKGGAYRPPRLYLGDTPLLDNSSFVATVEIKRWFQNWDCPAIGILGMDVLKHYCVQLDFQNGQVRFLDPAHADKKDWGRPFHLTGIGDGCVTIDENLTGAKGPSLIDTGADVDGILTAKLFQQWMNQSTPPAKGEFRSPNGTLGGEIYRDLDLHGLQKIKGDSHTRLNIIGIHVLSENLVTLDFPERTMYLKRTSDMPLIDKESDAYQSAEYYFSQNRVNGDLPGWTKNDVAGKAVDDWTQSNGLDLVTFDLQKKGEPSDYHFIVTRTARGSPWKLEKAWLTDQGGKTIEEFPVP
jgi:hypothetical protein